MDVNDYLEEQLGWEPVGPFLKRAVGSWIRPNSIVCELGPGTGRWARHVAPRVAKGELCLVDTDSWQVNFLRQYFKSQEHVRVFQVDGHALEFAEAGRFDLVFAFDMFILYPLGKIDLLVREFARVLRPGGRCLIQYADTTSPRVWDFLRNYGTAPAYYADAFVYHPPDMIDRVFQHAGFTVERRLDLHDIHPGYPFTALTAVRGGG